ncbi:DUF2515 family protein [Oceanobacillus limi]
MTKKHNLDNISRTIAYQRFYLQFPEIKWALVASLVSRNAGWNMTDLLIPTYRELLEPKDRERLFMTYERANWLIFSDAYPQLLLYKLSVKLQHPLFHLLKHYNVSTFMINEWFHFWKTKDCQRLMIALIINEQNVIQKPVIEQSFFKKRVFRSPPYLLQNLLSMNAVLIPTKSNKIFGHFVKDFTRTSNRIRLGKQIASILYSSGVYPKYMSFALAVDHTGSRNDYERYLMQPSSGNPYLRKVYPVITHQDIIRKDWLNSGGISKAWQTPISCKPKDISSRFYKKRSLLAAYYHMKWFIKL